jgi:predicted RNase H-like nuclease
MARVAGVDGCKDGWFIVLRDLSSGVCSYRIETDLRRFVIAPDPPIIIAIDIPIGILDEAVRGGRECDRAARKLLGSPRCSSVFSPPIRGALKQNSFSGAVAANRQSSSESIGISQQCFALFEKLREADETATPELQDRLREVHPELCFYELAGQRPMKFRKKLRVGYDERKTFLREYDNIIREFHETRILAASRDDFLDACAACWSAQRIFEGKAICIPQIPPRDSRGLRMEIWR